MAKKKNKKKNLLARKLGNREERNEGRKRASNVVFTFMDLDVNQGQSFSDWEKEGLAGQLLEKLRSVSTMTKLEVQREQVIKPYSKVSFPPNSDFNHPKHVPEGVTWCSMHLQGKECIIGFFEEDIFRIVFLDKDHRFWISEKK